MAKAHFYGYAREDDRPLEEELYDLGNDLGETTNLAKKHPEIVAELRKLTAELPSYRPDERR